MNESAFVGILVGGILGIIFSLLVFGLAQGNPTYECRDEKLFIVTHEGNITMYENTYKECEEAK